MIKIPVHVYKKAIKMAFFHNSNHHHHHSARVKDELVLKKHPSHLIEARSGDKQWSCILCVRVLLQSYKN